MMVNSTAKANMRSNEYIHYACLITLGEARYDIGYAL